MKKIELAGFIAGALSVAVIGLAGPAQADQGGFGFGGNGSGYGPGFNYGNRSDSNHPWLNGNYPQVRVPHVDTSVHN